MSRKRKCKPMKDEDFLKLCQYRAVKDVQDALLRRKVNVNAQDDKGRTALYFAVKRFDCQLIKILLSAGADINAQDNYGITALMFMGIAHRNPGRFAFDDLGEFDMSLRIDRECAVLQELLDNGADIHLQDQLGRTALMHIIISCGDYPELVNLLISKGADINARDNEGKTALMHACYNYDMESIQTLLSLGADVNVRDNEGRTVLMYVFTYCVYKALTTEAVRLFLSAGADANAQDNNGMTALMFIRNREKIIYDRAMVQVLLSVADVNLRDQYGKTALMYLASRGDPDLWLINMLLSSSGADINAQDNDGRTTLMHLVRSDTPYYSYETILFLLANGADASLKDNAGKDAVTYLRENWDKWNEQLEKDYYYERSDSYRAKEDFYREPEIIESTLLRLGGIE